VSWRTGPLGRSPADACGPTRKKKFSQGAGRGAGGTHGPVLLGGRPERAEDGLELVHVGLAGEVRRAQHQLGEYAPYGPDVDRGAVVAASEEQFGGAVPSGGTR
jgi:hypothetical protein